MSILVIDISYWQQGINYPLLAQQIDGVILRAAYGTWKDTWFDRHYENFAALKVPMGAYHFIVGNLKSKSQADLFTQIVRSKQHIVESRGNGYGEVYDCNPFPLGLWNDVEDTRPDSMLTPQVVLDYHNQVEDALETEMGVYTSASKWDAIMRSKVLSSKKLWIANYQTAIPALPKTGGWQSWWLWQYTDRERLAGYNSQLDANRFNGSRNQFFDWLGIEDAEPEPDDMTYVIEMLGNLFVRDAPEGIKLVTGEGEYIVAQPGETYHTKSQLSGWYEIEVQGRIGWISGLTKWTRITVVQGCPDEPVTEFVSLQQRVTDLERRVAELEAK